MRSVRVSLLVATLLLVGCGREPDVSAVSLTEPTSTLTTLPSPVASPTIAPTTPIPSPTAVPWHRVDEGTFSFELPEDMVEKDVQGIDSQVGQFESDSMALGYDYGWYSGDCTRGNHGTDRELASTEIDGREARMIFFRSTEPGAQYPYFACVFFPNVNRRAGDPTPPPSSQYEQTTALVMSASAPDRSVWDLARRIFESIRFDS